MLDPGGYGGVTITKSITISAEGVEAGVLVSGTNAIIVNAGATDFVVLRGLDHRRASTPASTASGSSPADRCRSRTARSTASPVRHRLRARRRGPAHRDEHDDPQQPRRTGRRNPGAPGSRRFGDRDVRSGRSRRATGSASASRIAPRPRLRNSIATDSTNFGFHVVSAGAAAELTIISTVTASNNSIAGHPLRRRSRRSSASQRHHGIRTTPPDWSRSAAVRSSRSATTGSRATRARSTDRTCRRS